MATRATYRAAAARAFGDNNYKTGTATSGSTTSVVEVAAYPFKTAILSDELYEDYYIYRASAATATDKVRRVSTYESATGQLTADLVYAVAAYSGGVGEGIEVIGALDPDTIHRYVNETLKLCEVYQEVTFQVADADDVRHSLASAASWLDDQTRVLQVGYLTSTEDRDEVDPYKGRFKRGKAIKLNGVIYLTGFSHNTSDTIYVQIARPAYTYCKANGGAYGDLTSGLTAETDEAVPQADWVAQGVKMLAYDEGRQEFFPGNTKLADIEVARAASGFYALGREYSPRPPKTFVETAPWGARRSGWLV